MTKYGCGECGLKKGILCVLRYVICNEYESMIDLRTAKALCENSTLFAMDFTKAKITCG